MAVFGDDQYGSVSGDDRVQLVAAWEHVGGFSEGHPRPQGYEVCDETRTP